MQGSAHIASRHSHHRARQRPCCKAPAGPGECRLGLAAPQPIGAGHPKPTAARAPISHHMVGRLHPVHQSPRLRAIADPAVLFGGRGGFVDVTAALRPCRTLPLERSRGRLRPSAVCSLWRSAWPRS
jgi:hypothetical protein